MIRLLHLFHRAFEALTRRLLNPLALGDFKAPMSEVSEPGSQEKHPINILIKRVTPFPRRKLQRGKQGKWKHSSRTQLNWTEGPLSKSKLPTDSLEIVDAESIFDTCNSTEEEDKNFKRNERWIFSA
jgi:hypothetical protein